MIALRFQKIDPLLVCPVQEGPVAGVNVHSQSQLIIITAVQKVCGPGTAESDNVLRVPAS
jgi:hypothetical protein